MTHDDSLWVMLCIARYGHLFSCQREGCNATAHHLENNSWEFHFHVWEAAVLWLCVTMVTITKCFFLMFETILENSCVLPWRQFWVFLSSLSYPWHSKYYSSPPGTSLLVIKRSPALSHAICITWPPDLISVSPSPLYTLITICFVLHQY